MTIEKLKNIALQYDLEISEENTGYGKYIGKDDPKDVAYCGNAQFTTIENRMYDLVKSEKESDCLIISVSIKSVEHSREISDIRGFAEAINCMYNDNWIPEGWAGGLSGFNIFIY